MAASDNRDKIIDYAGDFRLKACTIISYRKSPKSEKATRQNILPQEIRKVFRRRLQCKEDILKVFRGREKGKERETPE